MEPLGFVGGYRFHNKGRELTYSSVLSQTVSTRQDALYKSRRRIEYWVALVMEQKAHRRDMNKIAEEYDVRWDGRWDGDNKPREKATREDRNKEKERLKEGTGQGETDEDREGEHVDKIGKEAQENLERNS